MTTHRLGSEAILTWYYGELWRTEGPKDVWDFFPKRRPGLAALKRIRRGAFLDPRRAHIAVTGLVPLGAAWMTAWPRWMRPTPGLAIALRRRPSPSGWRPRLPLPFAAA